MHASHVFRRDMRAIPSAHPEKCNTRQTSASLRIVPMIKQDFCISAMIYDLEHSEVARGSWVSDGSATLLMLLLGCGNVDMARPK